VSRIPRIAAMVLALVAMGCSAGADGALAPATLSANRVQSGGHTQVHLERIGKPQWKVVDFHMFSAPIGVPDDGFATFNQIAASIQPPPNHVQRPDLGTGPGAPHPPPYDMELAHGLAPLGFHEGDEFSEAEFSGTNGVWLIWMTIPDPNNHATGSSPDFKSGAIISNAIFPIVTDFTTTRNGVPYDSYLGFEVPALDANLNPPFDVDGHSHFSVIGAEGAVFVPGVPARGHYEFKHTMRDQLGNGWVITARFEVEK
jgi:hypothetical protein